MKLKSQLVAICLTWIAVQLSQANAMDLDLLKKMDLWGYLNSTGNGLSMAPYQLDDEDIGPGIFEEVRAMRETFSHSEIKQDVFNAQMQLLAKDNPVGYVYTCMALANTSKEPLLPSACSRLFSDDEKLNFSLVYGLFVNLNFTRNPDERLLSESNKLLKSIEERKIVFAKVELYPDILAEIRKTLVAPRSKNIFER